MAKYDKKATGITKRCYAMTKEQQTMLKAVVRVLFMTKDENRVDELKQRLVWVPETPAKTVSMIGLICL